MNKTEQLRKKIKMLELKLKQNKTERAELKNKLKHNKDDAKATKAEIRYLKSQVKNMQKLDIVEQALKDLNK